MEEQISVIIPVYNVAEFLPQCLDSVVSQDYRNLQILLVDDGSTDGSGEICDRYAAAEARIQVIHQPNQGAGAAKNAGLRAAGGTYLSFVDSDDFLEPGAYRQMVKTLEETRADIVQFSFRNVYRNRTEGMPKPICFGSRRTGPARCFGTSCTKGSCTMGFSLRKGEKLTMSFLPTRLC